MNTASQLMREHGTIKTWNDDKGFGFIAPETETADVFLHISAFPAGLRRPLTGDVVCYELGHDDRRRPRALRARYDRPRSAWSAKSSTIGLSSIFLIAMSVGAWLGGVPQWVAISYIVMSALTLAAYASDKWRATAGAGRTPEIALHLLELFGGWPGALVAQQCFRHKTRNLSYQIIFWLIAAAHLGGWLWLAWLTLRGGHV